MDKELKTAERTEEIQDIIERMPSGFGLKITLFIILIISVFFLVGWIVKYPDVVTGIITINSSSPPVKLIANSTGRLTLIDHDNLDEVKEGEYIGVIQNGANLSDLQRVNHLIQNLDIMDLNLKDKLPLFPKTMSLGDLNMTYFKFLSAITENTNYHKSNLYEKQIEVLKESVIECKKRLIIEIEQQNISLKNVKFVNKFHIRDSILFSKKVLSESENDRSEITLISAQDAYKTLLRDISNTRSQLQQTENQLQQVYLQKSDKDKELELNLATSFTELKDELKQWEQKYTLKAPMSGKVQFLKFWTNNQHVNLGEPVFTIIPIQKKMLGLMTLPARGAGKVKIGQEVIIKLDDYPYNEYGSIKGIVSTIGLTTNELTTKEGPVETYLINIALPDELKTNYGKQLKFKFEIKGTADIITNKRHLLERLFDNLNYKLRE
jgi:hypothetical protein